jgi:predicted CXXCH cytochrome family protein
MFALALQASLLAACGRQGAPAPSAWVGSAACASCHADVASAWRSSTHHLAMLRAGPGEDLRAPLTADGPLVRRGDGLALTAASLGHDSDVRIDYALGHQHVEQYLGTLHEGRLQALPRAWDVRAGEWFDLFAGEERRPEDWGHWTNRGMNANAQCLFCHTTDYDKGYLPATDGYASRWSEMGVGCEACHGPGAEHVRARRDGGGADPYRGVDPERLLGACGSCHSRRVERARFTPGDDFFSAFEPEVFDGEPYYPDGQVKEELYELVSFATSRMYRKGVRCWNCHDPHANETKAPGNQLCRTCHDARYDDPGHTHHAVGGAGGDCRGCHMPVTVYMQRDPRHDHSFSRPDPEATELLGVPNACNRCHRDRDAAWAAARMREWYPDDRERARRRDVAQTIARGRAGDASAVPGLVALLRAGTDAVRRASAARLLARFPTASGVTDALDDALGTDDPMVRSGAAWALGERTVLAPEARDALLRVAGDPNRVVRQHVGYALRAVQPASLGADAARALDRAVAEWRDGQAWLGDTPEAHYNLAVFAATRGDGDTAVAEYREALRLWPESYQARHNLGMLLAQTGRLDEAAAEFEAVLARDPVPDTAFALGLLRAQQGRWPEAIAALERCVAADPSFPRGRYNLALAYAKSGDVEKAMDELEQAAALDDTHREAVLTLVDLARQVHDKARLERWVLEAARLDPSTAETPEVRELLERR